ncbi:MAG: hypothetical protein D9V45_01835 [Chloroflexi bacterium]|nr:MAG: hypothetical protein D9V45_01835 [Chloroflexota bacterium]
MAKEWTTKCKDCGEEFGYSDYSFQYGAQRGQSRPERCPTCRKIHNRLTGVMGFAYFELKPRPQADITKLKAGGLGKLDHPVRPHSEIELVSKFDPSNFGVTDTDIRKIFDWFSDPSHQVAVVVGPTGSGKSTALPFRLINPPDGIPEDFFTRHGQVLITQPRIQATRNIPAFVAKELFGANHLGAGYDIGFRYKNNPSADWRNRLVYATDGTLINWLVNGQISNLSVIMIDEAHERSLNIDLILGLLKKLLPRYPHLKLIIASATINSELFLGYFGEHTAKIIEFAEKRKYDVKWFFASEGEALPFDQVPRLLKNIPDQLAAKVVWLLDEIQAGNKPAGDILGFLQGEKPIEQAVAAIRRSIKSIPKLSNVDVFPLYTTLPQEEQNKALLAKPDRTRRRVVITTNVAETSLTVEDVVYVVDSGLINEAQWDPESQTKRVVTVLHSQAGCKQRWGRAGRVCPGQAFCLYTEEQFAQLFPPYTIPQIQRSDLESVVLAAKAAGIDDLSTFEWIQRPPENELFRAPKALIQIGALDESGDLTEHGLELQSFGEEPALANLMAMADQFTCAIEVATLIPMMKLGGMRYLLKNDKKWDAVTRREVNRIHKALMAGCIDDIDFCLKIYTAWSEAESGGRPYAPDWAIVKEWPQRIPKLSKSIEKYLGESLEKFNKASLLVRNLADLNTLQEHYDLGEGGPTWFESAQNNLLHAQRAAWGRAFYINHTILREKIEPERNLLLDSLSGHKKEVERRSIDFSRLDRVRFIMAVCLQNRTYINTGSASTTRAHKDENPDSETVTLTSYRPWLTPSSTDIEDVAKAERKIQINNDSVNFDQTLDAFTCGKQQVIVHPITPGGKPEPIMHVSYLARVMPEWLPDISARKNSSICLGHYLANINAKKKDDGTLSEEGAYVRLFLDQFFPIGSRWEYENKGNGKFVVKLVRQTRAHLEIKETFRGDEPELFSSIEDYEDVENADLVDNVLTKKDIVIRDPDEENLQPWQTMDIGSEEENPYQLAAESIPAHDRPKAAEKSDRELIEWISDFVDWRLESTIEIDGDTSQIAEITGYDFRENRPTIQCVQVPLQEPFDIFVARYHIGDNLALDVMGYDSRPGDYLISLITREPNSGLEIIIEPNEITFGGRGFLAKEIAIGTKLTAYLEGIDFDQRRAYISLLPHVEKFRDEQFARAKNSRGIYDLEGEVKDIGPEKVYLLLDISQPENGLLLQVDIGGKSGKGLHKGGTDAYELREKVHLRLQYQQKGSHTKLDELPKEIEEKIGVQRVFTNLAWEAGTLTYQGRLSYDTYKELVACSSSLKYRRALKDLYFYSNMLWGETVDINVDKNALEKYPSGTTVNQAIVSQMVSTGALVEFEQGVKGLLKFQDMTKEVKLGDSITVTVRKIEGAQRISLIMEKKYYEKIIIPQSKTPMVIGKGGAMIKSIMEQTHTNIDNLNVGTQTEFYIFGDTLGDVQLAKSKIEYISRR